ncbi:MAG: peptidase M14 [Planctomycetes bacterium]|nr:peptidase M14 [Planctomycetota bacterium]MCB9912926.1 peptidase M14 [Planctomycetota bacterium]HPF12750.1 M14 family metallopeptidase [Planctomycetota bacterium]HRV79820.1 M14 family metallopeptidase [Planctomycetota bacterium]
MKTMIWQAWALGLGFVVMASGATAQVSGGQWQPKVEIPWNRYYRYDELLQHMQSLKQAYPDFVELEDIGKSTQGQPMRVLILTDQRTGNHASKPGMWVDGNVHGNEVQGGEATIYLAWWLLEHAETNPRAKALLESRTFYLLPSVNPDGRNHWFDAANTPHSSRTGVQPTDNDQDGQFDEDPMDDLDGDGEILTMRKKVPLGMGTHRLDRDDPRILVPVEGDQKGDYIVLGQEGIDNDGDGRINEDDLGGYDMNRNWPSDWQPNHIQYGAGDYPLCYPETACIARFLYAHPNVAAVQSFHNSGGMILRGPGEESIRYPREDIQVYDKLGQEGELILPFYRYMIIYKDLYNVHGGFVTWTYESLGIYSFTNELWASPQYWGKDREQTGNWFATRTSQQLEFNDSVLLGDVFVDWHPFQHPTYGDIEIGGFKRQHGRVAPSFMIEEMLHRNALFCARHAEEIAEVTVEAPQVEDLGGGLARILVDLSNSKLMNSRSAMAADHHIGVPDFVSLQGEGIQVLASGLVADRYHPERMQANVLEPGRVALEAGVPGHGRVTVGWLVRGSGDFVVRYTAEKAANREIAGKLGQQ